MVTRRQFLSVASAALASRPAVAAPALTSRERVDRALRGEETDRQPFTFWYHFKDDNLPGDRHAATTLDFHRRLRTDIVKVMSDYAYPKPKAEWFALREEKNPFPQQIRALELIRDGLAGKAHFLETIFNPWNQATKIASKDPAASTASKQEVQRLKAEKPQKLLDALEVIAKSEANHARRAIQAGASGIFLAIDNAQDGILTREEYARFSEPFDRMILDAVRNAPINTLHLHGDKVYLDRFYKGWAATAVSYSAHGTGVSMARFRENSSSLLIGGLDEKNFRKLERTDLKRQWSDANRGAGRKFVLAPGCSVPDETTDEELLMVARMFGA